MRMASPRASGPRLPPSSVRFPAPGDVLTSSRGTYTVERAVGQGAYGAVYAAIGPFDQRYALKLLVPANRPYVEVQTEWKKETERLLLKDFSQTVLPMSPSFEEWTRLISP